MCGACWKAGQWWGRFCEWVYGGRMSVVICCCLVDGIWKMLMMIAGLVIIRLMAVSILGKVDSANSEGWICLSDGRYVVDMDYEKLAGVLDRLDVDVVCVNVAPELAAYHEKIRLDSQGDVAGFRRLYTDESRRCAVPNKQPHRTYIKSTAWRQLAEDRKNPVEYTLLQRRCGESGLSMAGVEMAGAILDLESEKDLLRFYQCYLKKYISSQAVVTGKGVQVADSARLFGAVILGSNVVVEKNVILSGPVMVGDNCRIGAGAVVLFSGCWGRMWMCRQEVRFLVG